MALSAPASLPEAGTESPRCPVCGAAATKTAGPTPIDGRSALACEQCETVFIWPRREQDFAPLPEAAYYDDWKALDLDSLAGLYSDVMAARHRVAAWIAPMAARPSILDVGCGAGHALTHFRAHGWQVRGIDPWVAATAAGRKYYRLAIETGRVETSTAIPAESQDLVIAIDVLQFTAEPKRVLEACLRALKPGATLYLTVPNFASAASRREGWVRPHFIPVSYLTYFTPDNLKQLAEAAGFEAIEIGHFGGPENDLMLRLAARRPGTAALSWADLGEDMPDRALPPLDRGSVKLDRLTPLQSSWRENGYLILPGFIPDEIVDRYCAVRGKLGQPGGWPSPTPYLDVPEIRELCLHGPLMETLEHLLGEPMGLHLNLTGWVSTERAWHQDDYLNPPEVNGHYAAVWTALDTIKPDSGPFEFVPGSHRWPFIRQANILKLLGRTDGDDPSWPWESERLLTPFFEAEIARRGAKVERFLGNKGDVLIWHARLVHRGSMAARPGAERRSMIAHYSAVSRRSDMPVTRRHPGGGFYFVPSEGTMTASLKAGLLGRLRRLIGRRP